MYHHNLGEQIEGLFASLPVCILFLLDFRLQVFDFCFSPWWKFPHQPGHPMRYEVGWWNGEIWGVKTGWNLPAFCWSKKKKDPKGILFFLNECGFEKDQLKKANRSLEPLIKRPQTLIWSHFWIVRYSERMYNTLGQNFWGYQLPPLTAARLEHHQ